MSALSLFESPQATPVVMRPYQEEALRAIFDAFDAGKFRGLLVLPTGTGKTSVFVELTKRLRQQHGRFEVLIIAHQIELLEQAAARMRQMIPGIRVSVESGDKRAERGSEVVIAGVQSIGRHGTRRLDWFRPRLIICDEAHHAPADSYSAAFLNFGVYEDDGPSLLGVTATPHRMDNRPLHGSDVAIFESILYTYTLRQAIEDGYLCQVRGYRCAADELDLSGIKTTAGDYNQGQLQEAMDREPVIRAGIEAWATVARDRRTIVFCTGVKHAQNVAEAFKAYGVAAAAVSGDMDPALRAERMGQFRRGELQVLTNMQLVTEGVDVPEIASVLMLRPTRSWTLYTQMVGRGLRISPGKEDCIVIDVVGNTEKNSLGKNPPAGLAGVFGLPAGLSLDGATIADALALFDQLDEQQQAKVLSRVMSLDELSAVLTEIDLLAELETPDDIKQYSHWSWIKLRDGHYNLSCGSTAEESRCRMDLRQDTLGNWSLSLSSSQRSELFELGGDIARAFQVAETKAQQIWPNVGAVANAGARWRSEKPTAKQAAMLAKLGVEAHDIARLNKGTASALLTRLFATARRRTRSMERK